MKNKWFIFLHISLVKTDKTKSGFWNRKAEYLAFFKSKNLKSKKKCLFLVNFFSLYNPVKNPL